MLAGFDPEAAIFSTRAYTLERIGPLPQLYIGKMTTWSVRHGTFTKEGFR